MGRKQRQREEEELAYDIKLTERLRNHASQIRKPEALTHNNINFSAVITHYHYWVNDPSTWVNRLKTKNIDKLRLDLIRYVFGVYRCPRFLENVWLPDTPDSVPKDKFRKIFIPWYLAVAQGKSLYKECTKGILTKKETHSFLMAPNEFDIEQNIWWARTYCESNNNVGIASRVARSTLMIKDYET